MNVRKLSVNKACIFLAVLLLAAMVTVSVALYALTQDITAVWYVLLFGIFVLFCSICFMVLVRRKLAMFSDAFCSLMDDMLSGNMQPKQTVEEESLFYKIEYRLNRLYEVMQENKNSIAQERADLQELISDISHQVKTPIANLKMINSTLLENEVPVQKQKEFLTAQASQLDKLDFLMQAMIKTSRLETGVISLEKKSQPLYDTLAAALGDILLNAEKKQINVQVDCPESLIVSHDRKWTGEALFNILDNAVKYTPEGGQIRVSVESWEMYVKIDIADRKAIKLSLMGIPIGLLLGWPIGRLLLPAIVNMLTDDIRIVTTVNPLIFLVAIVFSAITVFISCQKPAILAAKVSPMEALHYIEQTGGKKKQRRSKHISTMMMAKNNLTRNKKKVMIVTLSFALSIVLLNSVYTYVTSFDFDKFVADFSLTDFTVSDTTVINNYAPYNTANVSQDFISQAESLNGLEDIGNIYLWTSKQPLSENDLARLQELSACSSDIANELENYRVRQEHGVNVYGLDDFPAEYVQVLDGELNTEQWKAGTGVYVTPLRMMGDGSLCLYKPGDQISVTQLDGTNKVYDVLAVVSIPSALQTPLQVDMGLDYIFPTNELLGNMVSADQPAMKTIFNVDEGIYQCLPLVFQAHIQLAEPEQPEPDELLRDLGLCQLLFCNAGFKLTLGFFQLLQPLLGGTGQDTGLNRIEHILDTGFCIPELLFIKGNVGILLILQFHHLGDDGFHGGIVLDKLHGLVDHKIFQPLFTDSFLLAAFMLFGSSAFIIAVDFARPARTAFAKHQCTTVAAEQLGGEQVVILCLSTGRGFLVFQHLFLYIVEKLCRHNGGNRIGNQNITIFQLPDVAAIVQHMLNGVEGHQPATLVLDALFVQPIPNFPHGLAIVVPLEGFCHKGSSQRVDFKAVVCVDDVAKGNGTASELSLQCVFGHATNDLFRQVSGIILGITFQHRFQNDALRSLGDDLGGRHELDTVLLQLGLVPGTVVAVPGKTIQLPDQHDVKQLLVTVLNHLLKLRAVVRLGRDSTVNVVLDDGDAVLFRIGGAFPDLTFDGFFALVIR